MRTRFECGKLINRETSTSTSNSITITISISNPTLAGKGFEVEFQVELEVELEIKIWTCHQKKEAFVKAMGSWGLLGMGLCDASNFQAGLLVWGYILTHHSFCKRTARSV